MIIKEWLCSSGTDFLCQRLRAASTSDAVLGDFVTMIVSIGEGIWDKERTMNRPMK